MLPISVHPNYHHMLHRCWPDLIEFDFRPRLTSTPLHELRNNVASQQYFSSSETMPPNLWDFYLTWSHEFGSCLVTSSSAMEALGKPSISQALMDGAMLSEYRKVVYADDRYNDNILWFANLCRSFLRLSHEKSVKSMPYLKIFIKLYLMHKTNHV